MIVVRRPGPLTTVQDRGRPGLAHLGVPPAGAVDGPALLRAHRLVGNPDHFAGLECTLSGPELLCERAVRVAVTGGRARVRVDGLDVPHDRAVEVPAGGVLRVGAVTAGVRAYLSFAGGLDVPDVLGSRSTCTLTGLGPAPLRAGDRLPLGPAAGASPGDRDLDVDGGLPDVPLPGAEAVLRVRLGPRPDALADVAALLEQPWTVTPRSDRTGVRLAGEALRRADDAELPSEGVVTGALQVPPDGQPVLFLANRPTTGGYPVVAVVVDADLPLAAQARPGTTLRFRSTE